MTRSNEETRRLVKELGELVTLVVRAVRSVDDQTPLTSTQRLALIEIEAFGPLRLSELADLMGTTAPTASRAVEALVADGFVQRVEDPRDRRAVQIEVTKRGCSHVNRRRARFEQVVAPALVRLDASDAAQLLELLNALNEELRSHTGRGDVSESGFLASA